MFSLKFDIPKISVFVIPEVNSLYPLLILLLRPPPSQGGGASANSELGKRGGTGVLKRHPLTGDQTVCPVCQETLYSNEVEGMTCGHLTCLECYNALWAHAMDRRSSSPSCPLRCEGRNSDVEIRQLTNPVRPNSVNPPSL